MKKKRVLLGMSGGTDSSVSAIKLQEQNFEVIGVTFLFTNLENENTQHINDAKILADKINIEHHTVDLRKEFNHKIIKRFIREYSEGKTPFPCAFCNPQLKFDQLFRLSEKFGCDFISTGHYANIKLHNKIKYISKGTDPEKDQSFFLWGLKEHIIEKLIFPLGRYAKTKIREYARSKGFTTIAKKRDSLGICFINDNDYRNYLINNGIKSSKGFFKDDSGNILGTHDGIINYTIGQRRGLGIHRNKPLFVTEIRPKENEVILGNYDRLYKNFLFLNNTHFVDIEGVDDNKIYIVKIRYRLQVTPCKIKVKEFNKAEIQLLEPVAMVAKGQTAVFYENDRVIGGGFIAEAK